MSAEEKEYFEKVWGEKITTNEWTTLERMACIMGFEMGIAYHKEKVAEECRHPRSERVYIGTNMLRCNICGKEFK